MSFSAINRINCGNDTIQLYLNTIQFRTIGPFNCKERGTRQVSRTIYLGLKS